MMKHETEDDDDEHCETAGPHLAARPAVQQKLKHEQPVAPGDIFNGPQCDRVHNVTNYILRPGVGRLGYAVSAKQGKPMALWLLQL